MLALRRLKPVQSFRWSLQKTLFRSMPENNALQDLVDLCYDSICYEQQTLTSDVEKHLMDLIGELSLDPVLISLFSSTFLSN
jgi:hypothetical protein